MARSRFIPDDPALPALRELIADSGAPTAVTNSLRRLSGEDVDPGSGELIYVRYGPSNRCVLQYGFPMSTGERRLISLEINHNRPRRHKGEGYLKEYYPELRAAVQLFPGDSAIPELARCVSAEWVKSTLGPRLQVKGIEPSDIQVTPVSHKPWSRCVLRYQIAGKHYFAKLFADNRGDEIYQKQSSLMQALQKKPGVWDTSCPPDYLREVGMLIRAEVPGKPLSARLAEAHDGASLSRLRGYVSRAADGLVELQAAGDTAGLEVLDPPQVIDALFKNIERIQLAAPQAAARLAPYARTLRREIAGLPSEALVRAHRSFSPVHVYCEGARLSLIDLDNLAVAPASFDPGYFVAALRRIAARQPTLAARAHDCEEIFLSSWQSSPHYNKDWIRFYTRAALLRAATMGFFALHDNWINVLDLLGPPGSLDMEQGQHIAD